MLFNSIPFLLLFILTYSIYWNVNNRLKKHVLLISSVVFYSYFSLAVTVHFLLVIFVNFLLTQKLFEYKSRNKETLGLIRLIVILNLINLFLFKYFYFFMDSFYFITKNPFFKETGMTVSIVLPLAISFYTFQLIALQVDVHRDKLKTPISMQDYFIFIIFFPQLIAGPIMRTEDFLPQLNNPKINADSVHRGLMLLMSGLFKKVVIADNISPIIAPLYQDPSKFDSLSLAIGCLAFMSQVYCDFSGYTDMARGLAKLTGFEIPENFHGPLLSPSFRDLWARWHITLSTWLRDYLYIPLGGNKRGFFWSNLNMMITMSLGGLWHGANITYLLWGAFLGAMLWIERILEK
ncbi:MAG: MBOAT family protein, partial [Leptospira sp.]|nr:MBOAT family protein [Leptospira sp.]